MHRIIFTERAIRDLDKIDNNIQRRIASKLKEYANNPQHHARKLVNPKIGTYRFRIGDYRVVFDIDDDILIILRVGHRKNIYQK